MTTTKFRSLAREYFEDKLTLEQYQLRRGELLDNIGRMPTTDQLKTARKGNNPQLPPPRAYTQSSAPPKRHKSLILKGTIGFAVAAATAFFLLPSPPQQGTPPAAMQNHLQQAENLIASQPQSARELCTLLINSNDWSKETVNSFLQSWEKLPKAEQETMKGTALHYSLQDSLISYTSEQNALADIGIQIADNSHLQDLAIRLALNVTFNSHDPDPVLNPDLDTDLDVDTQAPGTNLSDSLALHAPKDNTSLKTSHSDTPPPPPPVQEQATAEVAAQTSGPSTREAPLPHPPIVTNAPAIPPKTEKNNTPPSLELTLEPTLTKESLSRDPNSAPPKTELDKPVSEPPESPLVNTESTITIAVTPPRKAEPLQIAQVPPPQSLPEGRKQSPPENMAENMTLPQSNEWLKKQSADFYTIQLGVYTHNLSLHQELEQEFPQVYLFHDTINIKPKGPIQAHRVLYGLFDNKDEAIKSQKSIPAKLRIEFNQSMIKKFIKKDNNWTNKTIRTKQTQKPT